MLRTALWTALSLLMVSGLLPFYSVVRADDDPAAATDASGAPVITDVTKHVEVKVAGSLRSGRDGVLFTGVIVENTSDADLQGRLVVVVDETGLAGVSMAANDGDLASGEHYLELLPETATLKPGRKTPSARIEFTSQQPIAAAARKDFAPKFRVLRIGEAPKDEPGEQPAQENLPGKNYSQARLNNVMAIQDRATAALLKHPGVFGTATSEDENGNLVIAVYTQRHGILKELPGQFEGVPLSQSVTGTMFRAGPAWTGSAAQADTESLEPQATGFTPTDPKARQDRPVPIGVSIFNQADVCAAGTLGCRIVFPDGSLGILSNSHVIAQESIGAVQADDPVNGIQGDQIGQPGCLDVPLLNLQADVIATLVDYQTFDLFLPNQIDAGVARINFPNGGLVQASTPPDGYGAPSRTPIPPTLGMRVVKYGRTTGLRQGTIRGLNANVIVDYPENGLLFFTNQIDIYGDNINFSNAGDSGSLVVSENGNRPVGLLYAGAGFETLANPIQTVLTRFNIAIDDGSGTPPAAGPNGPSSPGQRNSGRMGVAGGSLVPLPPIAP